MKELSMLTWLTQLGLSVALPLAGFIWLAVWLRQTYELGVWVIFLGVFLGLYCAVYGGIQNLKVLGRMHQSQKKDKKHGSIQSVYFNDHD